MSAVWSVWKLTSENSTLSSVLCASMSSRVSCVQVWALECHVCKYEIQTVVIALGLVICLNTAIILIKAECFHISIPPVENRVVNQSGLSYHWKWGDNYVLWFFLFKNTWPFSQVILSTKIETRSNSEGLKTVIQCYIIQVRLQQFWLQKIVIMIVICQFFIWQSHSQNQSKQFAGFGENHRFRLPWWCRQTDTCDLRHRCWCWARKLTMWCVCSDGRDRQRASFFLLCCMWAQVLCWTS